MEELIEQMKVVLATAFALYFKTHVAHWNVEGISFYELHKLFQKQYEDIWESLDGTAEQIRQLDAYTPLSIQRLQSLSRIDDASTITDVRERLRGLVADQETMIALLTECFGIATRENCQGLANYLADRIEAHTKQRWMLRASAKRHGDL